MNDSLIWNSNFQGLFLSPLIGAVMGVVLGYFFSPPAGQRTTIQLSYVNVVNSFNTEIHNHFHGVADDNSQGVVQLGIVVAMIFVYANYGLLALQIIGFVAAIIIGFGAVFIVRDLRDGAQGWFIRFVWPMVAAAFACYLLLAASGTLRALSDQPGGLSFATVSSNLFSRYGAFVAFQALGTALVGSALLGCGAALLYYAALGTMPEPADIFEAKARIAVWARRFSRLNGLLIICLQLGFAWLLISLQAYQWVWG
jgi:hypothetical protein